MGEYWGKCLKCADIYAYTEILEDRESILCPKCDDLTTIVQNILAKEDKCMSRMMETFIYREDERRDIILEQEAVKAGK